jgi:hypothetical protein
MSEANWLHAIVRPVVMTEGIEGCWRYHLSDPSHTTTGLCGKPTMTCNSPLDNWGYVGHLREKYCEECKRLACKPNAPVSGGTPSAQVAGSRIFEPYDGIPCTCTDKCDDPCKGGCGCKACYTSYQDFLSNE